MVLGSVNTRIKVSARFRVTAATRDETLRKLEAEIRYWLEMCPCRGEAYREVEIEAMPAD